MKQRLKDSIQEKFENIQLNGDQLNALNNLQTDPASKKRINKFSFRDWTMFASAAVFLMIVLGFFMAELYKSESDNLINDIATEVVQNHLHNKPLEVNTAQLNGVKKYFTRLDFKPISSDYLVDKNLTMLGGRYCSLQGVTAAQLRFKSTDQEEISTLYQVGYDQSIFKDLPDYGKHQQPVSRFSHGIKVTIWVEKGVLLALTEEPKE